MSLDPRLGSFGREVRVNMLATKVTCLTGALMSQFRSYLEGMQGTFCLASGRTTTLNPM